MSSYRKLAKKQALRLSMAIVAMTGGVTGWMATAHADGETNIQKADTANAGTITTSGNVWTVVPDKIEGDIATNAFSHFTLNQNNIANLRLYNSSATANKLVNLVSDSIDIRGTVNVLKNANTIGGDVYFLSKSGMAVGRTGVINAGSITALTPSVEWFDQHLDNGQAKISASDMDALKAGAIPLNADGSIVIDGKLNTQSGIHLRAPAITVGSADNTAALLQSKADLDFTDLVNIGSVSAGLGTLTATTGTKGDIVLEAAANQLNSTTNDVPKHTNTGSGSQNEIKAELTVGESAKVTGDRNITLSSYAEHSADENNVFGSTNSNTSAKLLGQSVKTTAHTTVNGKVTADGRLSVTAEAKNEASEKSGLTKSGPGLDFLTEVAGTLSVNVAPSYMVMSSEAKTKIGAAAVLTAKGTDEMDGSTLKNRALTVGADARVSVDAGATTSKIKVANVAHTNAVPAMAVGYVNAQSAADVTVEGNLKAEQGSADVHAKSHEDLQAAVQAKTTQVAAGADSTQIMNAAVLIARGSNTAQTKIAGSAVIDANKETNIISHTRTNLNTSATAAGKENSLLNAVVNVTKQDSAAHTEIQGSVKGGTAVHIRADNEQLKNIVQASTAVGSSAASTQFTNAALETNSVSHIIHGITRNIGEFRKKIGFPSDGLSSPTALDTLAQKVSLGGAINVVNETQRADVVLAPKATIHSNGAVGIAANSTVQGTRVQAQSAVNNNTNPDWYLTPDGKAGKVKPGQTEETQGMGSFAVNVVNIKNTASVTTLAAEESGTAHAPGITGKTVDIKSDAHFRYTNIEEMVGELLKSCDAVKTHCSNAGINSDKVSAVRDKAAAYRDKCRNDAGYIMSEEGLKEAKELADAIVEMGKFIKEAVGASNIFSNALAFADPSNYMTFQASAKFSGKTASQGKPDVEQAKIAGAAGVNFVDVDNNAAVVLGRGTQVTATEAVTVAADSTKRLVTLAGAPAWQAGADVALGGNVGITLGDTTADVIVAEGVQIRGESAEIKAKNRYDGIHLAIAAGKGGKVGFQGMANYVGGTSGAVTSVDDEAQITTDKAAKITAANTTNITNIAGSAVLGAGGAVGLSAALNNVAQTSVAAIANNDVAAEQQEAKTAEQRTAKALQQAQKRAAAALRNANGTAVSAGDLYGTAEKTLTGAVQAETLAVRAEQQGVVNAVAAAGAVSTGNDSSEKGGFIDKVGAVKENAQTKLGNLITLVDNKLQDKVKSPLNKLAAKDTIPMDAVKNLGFNRKQPSLSLDLAGSASVNISKVTTAAEMSGANVTLTKHASSSAAAKKNLTVSAQDSSFTGAWGGSMAIAWKTSQQSQNQGSTNVGIAGAVSVNEQKHRDVLALMAGNTIKGADSIENGAVQKGATVAAALGLALTKASSSSATSTAVPISLTYNNGGSVTSAQMRDNYVNAEANGTPITGTQKTDIANRAVSSNTQVSGGISTAVVTGSQSSNAVGGVVAVSNLKNDVSADITQTRRNTGALRSVGTLTNEALSGMTQIGAALGVGVASGSSSSKAVTGSFAVNNFENKAGAHLTNVTLTADSASVRADDKKAASDYANYLKARGIETSGDKYQEDFAKGNSKSSLAVDEHGNLTHNGGSTIVTAAASVSAAVGNGSSTAAGLGIGIGLIKNDFEAEVKGSDLDIRGTDGLNVESVADTRVVNVAVGAAGGSGFSAAGSASVIKTENKTSALVENSDIKAQKLTANALTKTLLVNVAGQVSVSTGGSGVAAGLATAVNILDNDTAVALRGGKLTLSNAGIVNLNAQNIGGIEALTAGVSAAPNAAISGGVSVNVGKNDTRAEIAEHEKENAQKDGAEITGATSVTVATLDATRQDAAVGGVSASTGGGAAGGSIAYNGLQKQQNTARISGAKIRLAEEGITAVNAVNQGALNTVALNVAGTGGYAAFAGAAAVADVNQNTTAEIVSSDIEAEAGKTAGDVNVQADGKLTARTFAIVGSGSSEGAAIGAGVAVNLLDADTNAVISGGKIHAANVLTNAAGNLRLHNIGVGVAATGTGASVSGSVAVNKLNNDTTAKITGGAKVTAEKNAVVSAKSDDRIQNYAGQITAAGTGAAVGLSVSTNIIGSNTQAEISGTGTEVISHATDAVAATTVKDGLDHEKLYNNVLTRDTLTGVDGLAEGRKDKAYRGVAVSASATHTANSFIVNGGGTGAGAAVIGTVNTNIVGGSTTATISDAKAAGAKVSVHADDATNSGALVGTVSVAGEGAAIGTGSSINLIKRTTEAEAARSTISAKDVDIAARSAQGVAVLTAGVSAANEASIANSNNFVRMEQNTRAALKNSTVDTSGLSVTADNTAKLNALALTTAVAGYGGGVGVGTAVLLDRSKTEADIAGTKVVYTNDQGETLVRATNTERLNNYVYSLAGGGTAGIGASISGSDVKNTVKAAVTDSELGHVKADDADAEAETAAKKIHVTAENDVRFDQKSGAAAAGALGASVGVSVNNFKATVESFVKGSKLYAREAADITAHDKKTITQLATNGAGGIAAVGLNIMVTNVGAEMQDSYTMEEGSSKEKKSVDAKEHTGKMEQMEGESGDRSKKGLSYVSSDDTESAELLAKRNAPSTQAKTSARAEQSDILVAKNNSGVKTRAGELNIHAQNSENINQDTMQAGVGGVAISGAAGIVRNRSNVETVAAGGTLSAHTITLDAAKDGAAGLKIYQGAAGGTAVNAAYGELNMGGRNDLVLSGTEMRAHTITGTTQDQTTGAVDIIGVAGSAGTAGNILVGNAKHDNVQTLRAEGSTLTADGDLTLSMMRAARTAGATTLRTTTQALAGGITFAGNGVAALARETGSMTMNLMRGNALSAAGSLVLKTDNRANIQAETKSLSASLLAAATATYASASFGTEKNAYQNRILIGVEDKENGKTDEVNSLTGKTITISTETNAQEKVQLKALSAAAGAGVQASGAAINAYSDAKTLLSSGTRYQTGRAGQDGNAELAVHTKNIHTQDLDVRGISAGGVFATATNLGSFNNVLRSDTVLYGAAGGSALRNAAFTTRSEALKTGVADGSGGALIAISPIAASIDDKTNLSAQTKLKGTWSAAGALDVKASTNDESVHDVDALQAAIVGGSGTELKKKLVQNAAVSVENAQIETAGAQNYEAKNAFRHVDKDAASGYGAGILSAGTVSSNMTETAKVTFTSSSAKTTGYAGITAQSLTEGTSKTTGIVKSAGVIPFTKVVGELGVTYDNGVDVRSSRLATAKADASITLASKDNTELRYEMNADTQGGLAGAAGAETRSNLNRTNAVHVDGSSALFSTHDANLYAGYGIDRRTGERSLGTLKLSLIADATNRTGIPLRTAPVVNNEMWQTNTVTIDRGAKVESVRHANLAAVTGYTQSYESAQEYTVWTGKDMQGSLTSTAGGKKVKNETPNNYVRVDGSVTAGVHNKLKMNIRQGTGIAQDRLNNLTARLDQMSEAEKKALPGKTNLTGDERLIRDIYMVRDGQEGLSDAEEQWFLAQLFGSIETDVQEGGDWFDASRIRYRQIMLDNPYLEEYKKLKQVRSSFQDASNEAQNLDRAIARLVADMKAEGFVDTSVPGQEDVLDQRVSIGIVLPDLAVSGGNVNIEAEKVQGAGSLTAKGAPVIDVQSSAERRILVQDAQIADTGGMVRLGDADLTSEHFGGAISTDKNASASSFTIKSTARSQDADIELRGRITSPGTVTIQSDRSSIRASGNSSISAAKIDLKAPNGYVTLSSPKGAFFIGNDPRGLLSGPSWLTEWLQNYVSDQIQAGDYTPLKFSSEEAFFNWLLETNSDGSGSKRGFEDWKMNDLRNFKARMLKERGTWTAGKDIAIAARHVSINGLVQSGFAGYRVKLDNNANTLIQNADRRNERVLVSGKSTEWDANAAGGRGAWVYHPEVYYNAKEGYLFTDEIEAGGGNITITGALSSTGRGRILARGGESDISIDTTAVNRELRLGAVKNRAGGGKVTLSDRNTGMTTEYLSNGKYRSYAIGTEEQNKGAFQTAPQENGMAYYAPKSGLTYNWTGGRSGYATQTTYTYGERFLNNGKWSTGVVGKNASQEEIDKGVARSTTTTYGAGEALPNGVYFGTGDTGDYYRVDGNKYTSNADPYDISVKKYYGKWHEDDDGRRGYNSDGTPQMVNVGWGRVFKYGIYFHKWYTKQTTDTNNTYHIAADKHIGVDFLTGGGTGNVNVHTQGNLVLNGAIRNLTNHDYAVNLKSNEGRIESNLGKNGIVYANNLTVDAKQSINLVQSAVSRNENDPLVTKVTLSTAQGAIDFTAQRGDLQIVNAAAGMDVNIRAVGKIENADPAGGAAVKGDNINLSTTLGAIDLSIAAKGRVDVTADGNITLTQKQPQGDLKVGEIRSKNGDVHLTAEQGSIIDAMPEEGTLSDAAARMERWRELGLTNAEDGVNESAKSAAAAKKERLAGLKSLGEAAARGMSAADATDAQVQALYEQYKSLSEEYRTDADIQAARAAYAAELKASHEAGWSAEDAYARTIGKAENKFFANKGLSLTAGMSDDQQAKVNKARTFIRDYKTLDESNSYGWSVNGLRYAIQKSVINAQPGQITEVTKPNIVGRNITLTAGADRGIGEDGATKSIANADLTQEENLRALSNARAGELKWTESGVEIKRTRPVKVQMREGGKINLSGDQRVYVLGKDSTLNLGTVTSNGNVDLQGDKGIYGGNTPITAAHLTLRGGTGGIGRADSHLLINAGGALDANATGGIYIKQNDSALLTLQAIGSSGDVVLTAAKGMRMTTETGKTDGYIKGSRITLTSAAGNLGTASDGIRIASGSLLFADAGVNDVHIASSDSGTLLLGGLKGKNISVKAVNGVAAKEADDKAAQITAGEEAHITSDDGNIALTNAAVTAQTVKLSAKNGITQSTSGTIKSRTLNVKSDGAVSLLGTQNAFPVLTMAGLSGDTVGGSVHIVNTGAMTVADLAAAGNVTITQKGALTTGNIKTEKKGVAAGDVYLHTDDKLTVQGDMDAAGSAELTAEQDIALKKAVKTGKDLTAVAKGSLTAANVEAGDAATLNAGTQLTAQNVTAGKDAVLTAGTSLTAANVEAGDVATLNAGTQLTVQNVTAKGDAVLHADIDLTALNVAAGKDAALTAEKNLSVRDVTAGSIANLTAGYDATISGTVTTGGNANLKAKHDAAIGGAVTAGGDFNADTGNNLTVNGAVTAQKNLTLHTDNDLTLNGAVLSRGMTKIEAGHDAAFNGSLTSDKNLSIIAQNNITVKEGANVSTKADGRLKARNADLGGDVHADGTLTIETDEALAVKNVTAGKAAALKAGTSLTAANVTAGEAATLNAGTELNAQNVKSDKGTATLKAGTDLTALNVVAGKDATLTADKNISVHDVTADGNASLTAGQDATIDGAVTAQGSASLAAQHNATIGGAVTTGADFKANVSNDLTVNGAITAQKNIALHTGNDLSVNGATLSHGMTQIDAGHDVRFNGSLTSDKNLSILAKNSIVTQEGSDLYTQEDGYLKAHTAALGGDVRADGTLTIETDETLSVKNVTAGKAATLKAGTDLKAANVTAGEAATLNAGTELNAQNVKSDNGTATLTAVTKLTAQNVTAKGDAVLKAGADLTANDVKAGGTADLHSQKAMETGSISADTVKLHAEDGDIHSHDAVRANKDASVSTGTQGAIKLAKGLTAGKDITFATKNGDMLFGGDIHSTGGNITATIAEQGNIGQIGDAKVSVKADAKGIGNVSIRNSGTGDVDLHRVYADRDVRVSLAHGNIHVYEINGALVAVALTDANKKMNLENIIAERRMIVQGSDMNFDNIRVREGSDGMLSIEPTGASEDQPIENFTMGKLDLGNGTGVKFDKLWANNMKMNVDGGKVRFDRLFIEGKANISYRGQETSIYGTAPQIDGNAVTYWNDVNRDNPRANKAGWKGMYLFFTGPNRQESNGNLLALSNYRFVYAQRENLVDFMGHALWNGAHSAEDIARSPLTDGKAIAMQEQAENADMSAENAEEDAITIEI